MRNLDSYATVAFQLRSNALNCLSQFSYFVVGNLMVRLALLTLVTFMHFEQLFESSKSVVAEAQHKND